MYRAVLYYRTMHIKSSSIYGFVIFIIIYLFTVVRYFFYFLFDGFGFLSAYNYIANKYRGPRALVVCMEFRTNSKHLGVVSRSLYLLLIIISGCNCEFFFIILFDLSVPFQVPFLNRVPPLKCLLSRIDHHTAHDCPQHQKSYVYSDSSKTPCS